MKDASLCVFPWDLQDEGLDHVLQFASDSGLTSIFLASVYHAGWFVRPHNPRQKCYLCEDGVAYFHPTAALYEATELKPQIAQMAQHVDWFSVVGERLNDHDLKLTAWTVCLHNTRLGLAHPKETIHNAWGDSYPHALTPGSPAARAYVRALVLDLATKYPLQSIFLEAPNYRGRQHGHHHERDGTPFGTLENELLDVSFSPHDIAHAETAGVDARKLQVAVAEHLDKFVSHVPQRPSGLPETIEQFINQQPSLADYRAVLDKQVESLISQIKEDICRIEVLLEGVEPIAAYDIKLVGAYGQSPSEVARLTEKARQKCAPHQELRIGLRLGFDSPDAVGAITCVAEACDCVAAAAENGADRIFFYNYSETPQAYLNWIQPALDGQLEIT